MKNSISIEKIKSFLSAISLGVLAIQHFVGLFAKDIQVSYIPLVITFFTFFVCSLGDKNMRAVKILSVVGALIVAIPAIVIYFMNIYAVSLPAETMQCITKVLYLVIALVSFILAIIYLKKAAES